MVAIQFSRRGAILLLSYTPRQRYHKRAQLARGSRRSTPGPARRRVDLESLLSYLKAYRAAPS